MVATYSDSFPSPTICRLRPLIPLVFPFLQPANYCRTWGEQSLPPMIKDKEFACACASRRASLSLSRQTVARRGRPPRECAHAHAPPTLVIGSQAQLEASLAHTHQEGAFTESYQSPTMTCIFQAPLPSSAHPRSHPSLKAEQDTGPAYRPIPPPFFLEVRTQFC